MATAPPPGWYTDPHQPQTLRYWDGQEWTLQTSPLLPAAPAAQPVFHVHLPTAGQSHYSAPVQQVVVNTGGPRPRWISGLPTWVKLIHLLLTISTVGMWAPIWWLHARLSRRRVIY